MATATRRRAVPPWWRRRRWYRSELPGERRTGVRNEYAGFRLRSAGRLRAVSAQLGARRFFDQYVATRTPVLVRGLLPELIEPSRRWLDGGLRRAAGQSRVRVELRGSSAEAFGRGNRVEMPFAELLRRLGSGDTSHYMTTQPLPALANGSEATVGPPLDKVQHEIPSRPSLLPSLQLQSVNLWVGCAAGGITAPGATGAGLAGPIAAVGSPSECSEIVWPVSGSTGGGASSGLHHDHHDNLLCLLRGTKVVRLFAPSDAPHLYTTGRLTRIHGNGRINYARDATAADGRTAAEVRQGALWRAQRAVRCAEAELASAEAAAAAVAAEAEAGLAEVAGQPGGVGRGAWSALPGVGRSSAAASRVDAAEAKLEGCIDLVARLSARRPRAPQPHGAGGDTGGSMAGAPPSFSRIPACISPSEMARRFPRARLATAAEVVMAEGEMLYMPAGWFHEVVSSGEHWALNFWFHPPDRPDFGRPYRAAAFWGREARRRRQMAAEGG